MTFQYKSDCGLDICLPFITVLGMSKISNNIGFDALLVFVQHQILSAKYLSVTFYSSLI